MAWSRRRARRSTPRRPGSPSTAGRSPRAGTSRRSTCSSTSRPASPPPCATGTRRRPSSISCRAGSSRTAPGSTRSAASTSIRMGLLLLTNDGPWAERVLHPRFGVEREYAIGVRMPLDGERVAGAGGGDRARGGLGRPLPPAARDPAGDAPPGRTPVPAAAAARLVPGDPAPGLEAPDPADVRRARRARRAARPGPHRPGAPRDLPSGAVRPLTAQEIRALGAGHVERTAIVTTDPPRSTPSLS